MKDIGLSQITEHSSHYHLIDIKGYYFVFNCFIHKYTYLVFLRFLFLNDPS
jgi:hypothetical protein